MTGRVKGVSDRESKRGVSDGESKRGVSDRVDVRGRCQSCPKRRGRQSGSGEG